ncbi:hypothetical protein COB21_02545 [Candidatus Aerophobetes bacterium]|uniref:MOMP-like family protein n=1 Tax=Aerophobetes bacterium TaxID=2030807 RepID=A0A2A4X6B7_UNCAE|nr:MAG: hypothetical protein COB21_02545 [Candidatus Aerophobetes bacterium]
MKNIIKQASVIGSLLALLITSGEAMEQHREKEDRAPYYRNQTEKKEPKVITPPASPKLNDEWDYFVTADFIYYKAAQEGTEFAYDGVLRNLATYTSASAPFASVPQGEIASVGQDWAPGFKVGAGLNTGHDTWSVYAEYTFLRFSNEKTLTQVGTEVSNFLGLVNSSLTNYYGSQGATAIDSYSITTMNADWKLNHNKINLDLARNFYVSEYLAIKPSAGLTAVWQKQTLATSAHQNNFTIGATSVIDPVFSDRQEMEAWGLGLRAGTNLGWYFNKSFSLASNVFVNTVWTDYNTLSLTSSMLDPATEGVTTFVNQNNPNYYCINYIVEMGLALRYEIYFNDNKNFFACQLGWDAQTWVNWGRFLQVSATNKADLSLHGLDVKFRLDF